MDSATEADHSFINSSEMVNWIQQLRISLGSRTWFPYNLNSILLDYARNA